MALKRLLVVNRTYPAAGLDLLKNIVEIEVLPYLDYEEPSWPAIKENVKGYDALIWNTKHPLTKEILDLAGPQLKIVSAMSSGFEHIDVKELQRRGIKLGKTCAAQDDAVADVVVGLLIAAARRFKEGIWQIENNEWKPGVNWNLGVDITGSTVGIVGLGGIGQAVVRRLTGFGVKKFVYTGRSDKPEAKELGAERVSLEQLLQESDHVILSCPVTPETKLMINADTLKLMKKNAVLVNVARGDVVDHDALYIALKEKQIFAAGLDVTTPEPLPSDHPLNLLPNCFVQPHTGSTTFRTRNTMAEMTAQNVILALKGEPMLFPVV